MTAKRNPKSPTRPTAASPRQPSRLTPRRSGILVLVAAGVVAVGVVAFVLFRPPVGSADPTSWATLSTADVHALAFAPEDPARLYFGHHNGLLESRDGGLGGRSP